ncbi:DUF4179 domain-containing protein [Brevibacillus sp. B_LB10_24]|uniref:DUF4179 domain-containing protein n=1 Tax=Brevibacillus sp. B_LB10_24 TaxID=3380645 RepID=UPI0038BB58A3
MKCIHSEELMKFCDQELPSAENRRIQSHLDECQECRQRLQQYRELCHSIDDLLTLTAPPLPESFTAETLSQLPPAEAVPQAARTAKFQRMKQRSWIIVKRITWTAAGLAVAISLGTFVSPTFAAFVKETLFNITDDAGVKKAAEQGFITQSEVKVTDQGITLAVTEVLADPKRIVFTFGLADKDGNALPRELLRGEEITREDNQYYLTDEKGNTVYHDWDGGLRSDPQQGYMEIPLEKEVPNKLTLHLDIHKIGKTKGNWHLQVPIDMEKSKTASKVIPVNQQYTTPQGIAISLKQVDLSPSTTNLLFQTELTAEWDKQIKARWGKASQPAVAGERQVIFPPGMSEEKKQQLLQEMAKQPPFHPNNYYMNEYGFYYRLLNERGEVVAAWDDVNDTNLTREKNEVTSQMSKSKEEGSRQKDEQHAFAPLGDVKNLTLELEAVYTYEPADFSMTVKPDHIAKQPVSQEYQGNTVTAKSFRMKTDSTEEKLSYWTIDQPAALIEIEGKLAKGTVKPEEWKVKDSQGNVLRPGVALDYKRDEDGTVNFHGWLWVETEQKPSELTLNFSYLQKEHRDVNWSVPITLQP